MILLTTLKTHLLKLLIGESSLELNQVAERAIEFARKDNHDEARRLRKLTRRAVEKSDYTIEQLIWRAFGILSVLGIAVIMYLAKNR